MSVDNVSRPFWKKILTHFISYLEFTLMGRVSWPPFIFVFLAPIFAVWWPNIWPKVGLPILFKNKNCSNIVIPGIYPYAVRPLAPIHFHVPSINFGLLMAKYLAEKCFLIRWVVIRAGVYCPRLWVHIVIAGEGIFVLLAQLILKSENALL